MGALLMSKVVLFVCLMSAQLRNCASQKGVGRLIDDIDTDDNGIVTREEITSFYTSLAGTDNTLDRCAFMTGLQPYLGSLQASGLFDILQSDDGQTLSPSEFVSAFLEGADQSSKADAEKRLKTWMSRLDTALTNPQDALDGSNKPQYTEFKIQAWADSADKNGDNVVSQAELSAVIRQIDSNDDHVILRCEFVDKMTSEYRQHPLTSSKVYDILFDQRDMTWADVDTLFLSESINIDGDTTMTKQEFINFFSKQNEIAAGVISIYEKFEYTGRSSSHVISLVTFYLTIALTIVRAFQ